MTNSVFRSYVMAAVGVLFAVGCGKKVCPEGPLPAQFSAVAGVVGPGVRVCADDVPDSNGFYVCVVDTAEMDAVSYASAEKKLLHHMATADGWQPHSLPGSVVKTINGKRVIASLHEIRRIGPTCASISFSGLRN